MSKGLGEIAVFVTRLVDGQLELLARPAAPGAQRLSLPTVELNEGEHPCEAAWRATGELTAGADLPAFRRLTAGYYQTSPEDPEQTLPGFAWLPIAVAEQQLSAADGAVLRTLG